MDNLTLFDSKNFLSSDERENIKKSVFSLKNYWKNMLEYPCQDIKNDLFKSYYFKQLLGQIKYTFLPETQEINLELCEKVWKFLHESYSHFDIDIRSVTHTTFINILKEIKSRPNIDNSLINKIYLEITKKDRCQNNLGDAIYLLAETKRSKINWEVQKILKNEFNWLYQKTAKTISNIFESPVALDDSLTLPGFHIFTGCDGSETKCDYNYHEDITILDYYSGIDKRKIYSFISLIDFSTDEHPHLEYKDGFDSFKKQYEYGTLHFWSGIITHKIGTFSINKNQHRITYQGHVYFDKNENIYKLYF